MIEEAPNIENLVRVRTDKLVCGLTLVQCLHQKQITIRIRGGNVETVGDGWGGVYRVESDRGSA